MEGKNNLKGMIPHMQEKKNLSRILTSRYAFVQSSYWMAFCAVYNFATVYLLANSFSPKEVGIILATTNIFAAILQPVVAGYADRTVKITLKNLISIIVVVILSFAVLLMIAPKTMYVVGVLFLVISTLMITIQPLINSLGMEYLGKGIQVNFGMARGMGSLFYALTSLLLGNLVEKEGTGILPFSYIVIFALLLVFTFRFKLHRTKVESLSVKDVAFSPQMEKTDNVRVIAEDILPARMSDYFLKYRKYSIYLIGLVFLFTCFNMINVYMIKIVENVGGDKAIMGNAFALAAVLELPVMFFFSRLLGKWRNSTLLKISIIILTLKSIATLLATSIGMVYFAQSFQMLSYAIFIPSSIYYVNQVMDKEDRIKGQAFVAVTMTLGGVFGSLFGGWLLGMTSVYNMLLSATVLSIIGTFLAFFSIENMPNID